jgi:poly-D-alanine transfer protein DltD
MVKFLIIAIILYLVVVVGPCMFADDFAKKLTSRRKATGVQATEIQTSNLQDMILWDVFIFLTVVLGAIVGTFLF